MSDIEIISKPDSNLSQTIVSINTLKKNDYMLFQNHPCKIVEYKSIKTGKHGHAKINLIGIDIFNGKKYQDTLPSDHNVIVPEIKRTEFSVINCDEDNYLSLMDLNGNIREDLKCPNEVESDFLISEKIKKLVKSGKEVFVTVLEAMKIEKIVDLCVKD